VNLTLLAVPTATIGPDFEALGNQYNHFVLANEIDDALFVTEDASLVTVFAGGNDVEVVMSALGGGAGASNQTAYIDSQIAAFGTDYSTLLADVHSRAGSPRIVVMNLPNFAGIPMHANDPLINREALQRLSVGMTTSVINKLTSQGVLVVDLMCNSQFYDPSIYSSDGFHPNDTGYALMSSLIVQAVNSTSYPNPPASCSQMTLVP
jgi:lysophospholipase L1-like esterase